MARQKKEETDLLTDFEIEVMNVLWALEKASVSDVQAKMHRLQSSKKFAYTTISTMLRVLEKKNFVGSEKVGRGHNYFPILKKEEYQKRSVQNLVSKVFDDTPKLLLKQLVKGDALSKEDLSELRKLLEEGATKK